MSELGLAEGIRLVLIVDQFEELFRYTGTDPNAVRYPDDELRDRTDEAAAFAAALLAARDANTPQVHVVITMRSDFVGECARFLGLPEAVDKGQFLVPRMTRSQLEAVVREPLRLANASISAALVQRLLNDTGTQPDALPVLQHALLRTWQQAGDDDASASGQSGLREQVGTWVSETDSIGYALRRDGVMAGDRHILAEAGADFVFGRKLLPRHYEAAGTMRRALSDHADAILSELAAQDSSLPELAQWLFRALSDIDKEGRAVRRPQRVVELVALVGAARRRQVVKVLDRFRADDCSFLTPSLEATPTLTAVTVVDIGHEALLRNWRKIGGERPGTGWLADEFEDGLIWRSLLVQARSFANNPKAVLSAATTVERARWLAQRPSPFWARRHTDAQRETTWSDVQALMTASEASASRERIQRRRVKLAFIAFTGALMIVSGVSVYLAIHAKEQARQALQGEANSYWRRLQFFADPLRPEQLTALWDLAGSNSKIRVAFIQQLMSDPSLLPQFGMNPEIIARAVGLKWPDTATNMILQLIGEQVKRQPGFGDNFTTFQTMATVRAIVALSDTLDSATRPAAVDYVRKAVHTATDMMLTDPGKIWPTAQMVSIAANLMDGDELANVRISLNAAVDTTLARLPERSNPGVATGLAIGANLIRYTPSRAWAAFDYLNDFIAKPNMSFGQSRVARLIGPLVDKLQPLERARMRGRELADAAQALFATISAVTTESTDPSYPLVLVETTDRLAPRIDAADVDAVDRCLDRLLAADPSSDAERARSAVLARVSASLVGQIGAAKLPKSTPKLAAIVIGGRHEGDAAAHAAVEWSLGSSPAMPAQSLAPLYDLLQTIRPGERGYRPAALARVLSIAAPRLRPDAAAGLADAAIRAAPLAPDAFGRAALADLLAALVPILSPDRKATAMALARVDLAASGSVEEAAAWARLLGAGLPTIVSVDDVRALVEVLKYPTAAGQPTKVLLQALESRLPPEERPKVPSLADLPVPSLVAWLEHQYGNGLDLSSRPSRPMPLPGRQREARTTGGFGLATASP